MVTIDNEDEKEQCAASRARDCAHERRYTLCGCLEVADLVLGTGISPQLPCMLDGSAWNDAGVGMESGTVVGLGSVMRGSQ